MIKNKSYLFHTGTTRKALVPAMISTSADTNAAYRRPCEVCCSDFSAWLAPFRYESWPGRIYGKRMICRRTDTCL
ncbi:hypothetical protein HMPREF1548_06770 [Clostridium sp. KLE 1755]|nr:hypothetical protein HMPREF1548_06770 [Clostridium sp. KLE 1755]